MSEPEVPTSRYMKTARSVRSFAVGALAVVGFGTVASVAAIIYFRQRAAKRLMKLPEEFVLELDLESTSIRERANRNPLQFLQGGLSQLETRRLVRVLDAAKDDPRVRGMVMYVGQREHLEGMAQVQEVRSAISRFRLVSRNTPTVAFSSSFGEGGANSATTYYLATAMEKVFVQPHGAVSAGGFNVTLPFLRGLLDKLGVRPLFLTREEYKNAAAVLTDTSFSKAHLESTTSLLNSMDSQVVEGVASARGMDRESANAALKDSPHNAEAALRLGLIDGMKFRDEVQDMARGVGGGAKPLPTVSVQRYLASLDAKERKQQAAARRSAMMALMTSEDGEEAGQAALDKAWPGKPHVALVQVSGPIVVGGTPGPAPPGGQERVEGTKLIKLLQRLRKNDSVKAVVLRINSPGGSAVASNSIHREVLRLKEAGKTVVVSMGDVAASGGYFIAAPANRILASPGTVTGSIGVIFGKLNVRGLAESLGINPQSVSTWPQAGMVSPFEDLTPQEEQRGQQMMDELYFDFMDKVGAGRGMDREAVRKVAKGRVWTGQQALEVGLVDELGGLDRAVAVAREVAGLPEDAKAAPLVEYGPSVLPPILEMLRALRSGAGMEADSGIAGQPILAALGALVPGRMGAATAAAAGLEAVGGRTAAALGSAAGDLALAGSMEGPQMLMLGADALCSL